MISSGNPSTAFIQKRALLTNLIKYNNHLSTHYGLSHTALNFVCHTEAMAKWKAPINSYENKSYIEINHSYRWNAQNYHLPKITIASELRSFLMLGQNSWESATAPVPCDALGTVHNSSLMTKYIRFLKIYEHNTFLFFFLNIKGISPHQQNMQAKFG